MSGSTQEEHDRNLEKVLSWLEEKDLRLQVYKCNFSVSKVPFLGHIFSGENGVSLYPDNLKAIKEASEPKNLKGVLRFLGMVRYYSDFLYNYATHGPCSTRSSNWPTKVTQALSV